MMRRRPASRKRQESGLKKKKASGLGREGGKASRVNKNKAGYVILQVRLVLLQKKPYSSTEETQMPAPKSSRSLLRRSSSFFFGHFLLSNSLCVAIESLVI